MHSSASHTGSVDIAAWISYGMMIDGVIYYDEESFTA